MIDTHCHVDLYSNPFEIINQCEREGIVTIGMTNLPSHFEMGYPHVMNCKKVRLALGLHPLYAKQHSEEFDLFLKCLSKTSYIGEIGLDFSKEGIITKEIQLESFQKVLFALRGQKKILSLHSRKAEREILELLVDNKTENAIFHWYSGPLSLIDKICESGYYFSINPAMIKSYSGKEIIKKIPKNRLLTESDGPFVNINNRVVKPIDIKLVLLHLSVIWNMDLLQVESIINDNFKRIISNIKVY